jgi:putative DNA primase/helicase
MRDLRSIARALGGNVFGRHVMAPGPGHSRRDRSLKVTPDTNAPDGFLVHSYAGDDWQVCKDYVRNQLALPPWEPGDERDRTVKLPEFDQAAVDYEAENYRMRTEEDYERIERARQIWDQAKHPAPAKAYFASRALDDMLERHAGVLLRYHPRTPWRNENSGRTEFIPCLLAAYTAISDDTLTGIHRIRLDRPQLWPKTERRMFGVCKFSAMKLGPIASTLSIGEGLETCLAAIKLGAATSCWALGSVGSISFFPVLERVNELKILVETGQPSAEAFKNCGRRWRRAGKTILRTRSYIGDDLNDALMSDMPKAKEA